MPNNVTKKKILFVEDQPQRNRALQDLLSDYYLIENAVNAGEAYEKTRDNIYDCLILDIMIPVGTLKTYLQEVKVNSAGITLLNWLRKTSEEHQTLNSVPVIAVSAIIDEKDIKTVKNLLSTSKTQQLGFTVEELFFTKPYKLIAVKAVIDRLLEVNKDE